MMELLKKIDGLFMTPLGAGADALVKILSAILPFRVFEFQSGREHNGWIIPQRWEVVRATIHKDGKLIYDGTRHPLGVIGSSESFHGKISLADLAPHLFYKKDAPDNIVYHCDLYYKPYLKNWGFSLPYNIYSQLEDGLYDIDLETTHSVGTMKVLEYTHPGTSKDIIVFNAHNCHAAQLNDGPAGYVVFMEVLKRLRERKTKYNYRLVIAPEHLGTVFYLADLPTEETKRIVGGMFMEMVGHDAKKFALQESFTGKSMMDIVAHHVLKFRSRGYWSDNFRKIVGNDETVWEAPGIEVPMISLSRCESKSFYYPQYHLDSDNISIVNESQLEETVRVIMAMIDVFEQNCTMQRKFTGLIALSNPKYNLYMKPGSDPSMAEALPADQPKWNYLMDCLPRYFDGKMTVLDVAIKHDLSFDAVYAYIKKFEERGLIELIS